MRRLERVAAHVAAATLVVVASPDELAVHHVDGRVPCMLPRVLEAELARLFGPQARAEGPLMASGGGLRLTGVDLRPALSREQAAFLVDARAANPATGPGGPTGPLVVALSRNPWILSR